MNLMKSLRLFEALKFPRSFVSFLSFFLLFFFVTGRDNRYNWTVDYCVFVGNLKEQKYTVCT